MLYYPKSSGGFFGKELKFAGIDLLLIKGASDEPVYISIQEDDIEMHHANNIWGENIRKCTDMLSNKGRVACIRTFW